jgi:hypothetical protein
MIFTLDDRYGELKPPGYQYIKDEGGYIIGSANATHDGWFSQSCLRFMQDSWSAPEGPHACKQDAVNAAVADYIARRME